MATIVGAAKNANAIYAISALWVVTKIPPTWAMMLIRLGGIGMGLRARKRAGAASAVA